VQPEAGTLEHALTAAQRGDVAAFNTFVQAFQRQAFNVCYRTPGHSEDAAYATFELEGGIIAHFNSSWCVRVYRDELFTLQVDGIDGSAVAGLRECKTQHRLNTPMAVWNPDLPSPIRFQDHWLDVPAMSDPDVTHAREALARLEHLVVQDLFLTETAKYADVVLPASAWPEKVGTVSNTNRQVQMGRKALPLPGGAREDFVIIVDLAKRLGLDWSYAHPRDVFAEMKKAMPSLDNISWERVQRESAVTYPADAPDEPGHDVVFDKGFPRPGGFGKLVAAKLQPPAETPNEEYPFILTTGRHPDHAHHGAGRKLDAVVEVHDAVPNRQDLGYGGVAQIDHLSVAGNDGCDSLGTRTDVEKLDDEAVARFGALHGYRRRCGVHAAEVNIGDQVALALNLTAEAVMCLEPHDLTRFHLQDRAHVRAEAVDRFITRNNVLCRCHYLRHSVPPLH